MSEAPSQPTAQALDPGTFPLWGSRLIEASAGTGKTWTIAALYVRLVLGHGDDNGFVRPLIPAEILVMTFTRAATRELSDRIRARLVEAARCFRGEAEPAAHDGFLRDLLAAWPDEHARKQAALRLALAAQGMDEAAVFTIDAWCQRMLREHAFDSGSLFNEQLVQDESELLLDATRDYWREHVYRLDAAGLEMILNIARSPAQLARKMQSVLRLNDRAQGDADFFNALSTQAAHVAQLLQAARDSWCAHADALTRAWFAARENGWLATVSYNHKTTPFEMRMDSIRVWAETGVLNHEKTSDWLRKLTPTHRSLSKAGQTADTSALDHPACHAIERWLDAVARLSDLQAGWLLHAADWIEQRMQQLKKQAGTFGFEDMLRRLDAALRGGNGVALRAQIIKQYPVALIDEFQDTSPLQYRIFDALYRVADNDAQTGLFLIGDPKQSIYGFRGADIHSYLSARRATAGRHYVLTRNFRSAEGLVAAANRLFHYAESNWPAGAFRFRTDLLSDNPLPFDRVDAQGRSEVLVGCDGALPALTFAYSTALLSSKETPRRYADLCAEQMVTLLNDPAVGFAHADGQFQRLQPADLAVLVRNGNEAALVRRALQRRGVPSVYLSDKDSVFESQQSIDILRWLTAIAAPLDAHAARAAWATATAGLALSELEALAQDDLAWDARIEQMKSLHLAWQRQGVLAMLRQWLHLLDLPARLLAQTGGERALTNLLHLAELLQSASQRLDGEQALIRWLAEQIAGDGDSGDERIVRLESDAELVQIVTVHKSKGLEYPLVFLPFAHSYRAVDRRGASVIEYLDEAGQRQVSFDLSDEALRRADAARLQEDLRLLYVAVTRARHAMWLGVAVTYAGQSPKPLLDKSALGYLLGGGSPVSEADLPLALATLQAGTPPLALLPIADEPPPFTRLQAREQAPALPPAPHYVGTIDQDWSIASFSSLIRDLRAEGIEAATSARDDTLQETPDETPVRHTDQAAWHRFPRGPLPGTLLHDQLEWLARQGFDYAATEDFATAMAARCKRVGWSNREADVIEWLRAIALTPLQPLGIALAQLPPKQTLAEMEFWFPTAELLSTRIDALCRQYLLPEQPRPILAARTLRGMVKGYVDLVFEHEGRYWLVDYKSNALGVRDADYSEGRLAAAMAEHRYDVQGTLYLLALHRLLQQRLGEHYNPAQHLGGAVYFFLRGINGPEAGCYVLPAHPQLINTLDASLKDHEPA
ncbi:exodeoxyribonuclease V subunit beta [Amantichitinum ursilacus]|uniref:RecBCD enzyme subunit RecB n=1 Tax=Amantichitinum ursilacus TaxID=857265 RepID=A0A0N0GLS9_9NEIS|nr:exodeoxyribonuclease V subunit beta [Amantichitinum ursilacus]KPC50290.1 RecBCD enzyme subunit RecB [Amantichitinum ursilacus]